jgi:hypothetical protein
MVDDDRPPNKGPVGGSPRPADGSRVSGEASGRGDSAEPRANWLRRIIGKGPSERKRLGEAIATLLGTALIGLAAIGGLVIWHLVRRGRIIRERLGPPRNVRMPEPRDLERGFHDHQDDDLQTA